MSHEPTLTEMDRHSATWKKLQAHYEDRLAKLRVENDGRLNADDTARLRGRIHECKALLALGTDRPVIDGDGDTFKD